MIPPAWHCCLTHIGCDPKRWIFRNGSDSAPQDEHLWFWLKAKIDGWKTKETLQFSTHIYIYIYNAFQNVHMHVSNAWCFLHHGVRWKVFHSSVSSTNLDFVHLRSIWFPNQITRDLLWKWNGRKKCIDCGCWSYAICTSSFTYLFQCSWFERANPSQVEARNWIFT